MTCSTGIASRSLSEKRGLTRTATLMLSVSLICMSKSTPADARKRVRTTAAVLMREGSSPARLSLLACARGCLLPL